MGSASILVFVAAIAPALFLLHYFYVRDKYEREPLGRVITIYLLSFLAVIPAGIWELNAPGWHAFGIAGVIFATWGVVAVAEETLKFVFLRWLAVPHPSFNEVYDGVLYGATVSLGFATAENIVYVLVYGHGDVTVAVLRGLTSVPGHAMWGVMLGYFVGRAKFAPEAERVRLTLTGWGMAVFFHGLFDFLAYASDLKTNPWADACAVGVVGVVIVSWIIGTYLLHRAQQLSQFKRPSVLVNPIAAMARARYCNRCGFPCALEHATCSACGYELPPGS